MNKFFLLFRFRLARKLFQEIRNYADNPQGEHNDLYTHALLWHMRCVFHPQHLSGEKRSIERREEINRFRNGLAYPKSLLHFIKLIDELLESTKQSIDMGVVYSKKNELNATQVDEFSSLQRSIHSLKLVRTMAILHPRIFSKTLLQQP